MKKQYTVPGMKLSEARIKLNLMGKSDIVSPNNKMGNGVQLSNEREDCDDDTPFFNSLEFRR